jgi:hypothetical protein
MSSRSGDFQGAFDMFLPLDIAEISLHYHFDLIHLQHGLAGNQRGTTQMGVQLSQ